MQVSVEIDRRKFFFDRPAVIAAIGKANARGLMKSGGLVRTISRRSLRRRNKSSVAGSPPSVHSSHPYATFKNILFSLDPSSNTVVTGPVKLGGRAKSKIALMGQTVPELHEKSGTVIRERTVYGSRSIRKLSPAQAAAFRQRVQDGSITLADRPKQVKREAIRYPARPFMGPALAKAAPKLPELWRNSVRG